LDAGVLKYYNISSRHSTAMDPSITQSSAADAADAPVARSKARTESMSQKSDDSQTAAEYVTQDIPGCHVF
jgi:hypothetical protein